MNREGLGTGNMGRTVMEESRENTEDVPTDVNVGFVSGTKELE